MRRRMPGRYPLSWHLRDKPTAVAGRGRRGRTAADHRVPGPVRAEHVRAELGLSASAGGLSEEDGSEEHLGRGGIMEYGTDKVNGRLG